jgi:transketolase
MGQKIKGNPGRVIALVGDGECQEGTIWESAHVAANRGLDNLCVVVDWNGSGAQLTPQDNLPAKWAAFGWDVVEIDGHDTVAIEKTFQDYRRRGRGVSPLAVVAHTVKGKGVSFIEGHGKWHHRVPDPIELAEIMKELAE